MECWKFNLGCNVFTCAIYYILCCDVRYNALERKCTTGPSHGIACTPNIIHKMTYQLTAKDSINEFSALSS